MKKKTAVLLALLLITGLFGAALAGCGENIKKDSKVTLQILNYKREAVEVLEELAAKFEKENQDIHIQVESPNDALTILKTRLVKEDPPDIAFIGGERSYADFVDAGCMVDLSGYEGLGKVQDVYQEMAKQLELKKKEGVYCIPYAANAAGVLYNRDMFEAYGWKIPRTWNEFMELCQTIQQEEETPFFFMLKDSWTGITPWNAIAANLTSPDVYTQACLGETTFSLQYGPVADKMDQLLQYGQEDPFAYNYNDGCTAFAHGESAMLLQGNWAIPQILSMNPDMNVGAFVLPVGEQEEDTLLVSGIDVLLSVMKPDHKEECQRFLDFMLEEENVKMYLENQKAVSCLKGEYEIPQNLAEMASYWEEERVIDFPDHHYPADLPAADMLQGYLMNGEQGDFLARFDREWNKSNRALIDSLKGAQE